ncbi:MAG: lytic transglycosylase domain-containing protein [Rhodoferax sp.]|uniref:lytic transglycosylase domain-containing protein n=1 Tax=Rhodoferax sp. TaxID=50421 RepID=UPI00271FB786|nr:lytic transglycosylase domain-containing protein [Rhodoferax sp.]MDO8448457.1 lytic transglycosylase domain-containing protein [Rhodoferax sp.]
MTRKHMGIWLLLGCSLCRPGWAEIYSYTADDGTVSLSNVPTDDRYTVLISATKLAVTTAPLTKSRKGIAGMAAKAGYDQVVNEVSRTYGLESALLHAVISVESRYNPKAVSKKGATGLMQLMPQTAKRYGVADAFDPRQNLDGGAHYLRDLLRLFDNNVSLALAAYNAGEHAVMKHGNRIPPYSETLSYVPKVLDFYQRYQTDF